MTGVCQFCKCTTENSCDLGHGEECGWLNPQRDCCTNVSCVYAYQALKRKGHRETEATRRRALRMLGSIRARASRSKRTKFKKQTVGGKQK